MTYTPDKSYSVAMRDAIKALAKDQDEEALKFATVAMNVALYKMMDPITSVYVVQAHAIRTTVFMLRRL